MQFEVQSNTQSQAVSLMKAASISNLHLSTLYKMRSKLDAFQQDGVWYIPLTSLNAYIQKRAERARQILASSGAAPTNQGY
jgi:hypothetical protein